MPGQNPPPVPTLQKSPPDVTDVTAVSALAASILAGYLCEQRFQTRGRASADGVFGRAGGSAVQLLVEPGWRRRAQVRPRLPHDGGASGNSSVYRSGAASESAVL